MLLPSALPCDQRPALHRFSGFKPASRPSTPLAAATPPPPSVNSSVLSSCKTLHSLLGIQAPASSALRARKDRDATPAGRSKLSAAASSLHSAARVRKRPPVPPRGKNKRMRDEFEREASWEKEERAAAGGDCAMMAAAADKENLPSTPKRQRRAPPTIPFGLELGDFYSLHDKSTGTVAACTSKAPPTRPAPMPSPPSLDAMELTSGAPSEPLPSIEIDLPSQIVSSTTTAPFSISEDTTAPPPPPPPKEPSPAPTASEAEEWTSSDDQMLVDLVLEKLRLSRREWDECARVLGADQRSLGARWRYLVREGQIGLRLKFRRGGVAGVGGAAGRRMEVRGLWQ